MSSDGSNNEPSNGSNGSNGANGHAAGATPRRAKPAVRVVGLGKSYSIAAHRTERPSTLAESALAYLRNPFARQKKSTFWALSDIDLEVAQGDVVGIIGRNGAGKSTLLKVLSRITAPTTGRVELFGRIGSLLEVGTGFHPELTGRENIFLNGQILGMKRREIARQFDAIVDFSGVEKFLDTPVKRYSSGMYVRLAFAVAAHLEPEILIVDEVLAVGDSEFQTKCLGKMKDVAESGRTVLFVSHNMQAVNLLCKTGVFLSGGRVQYVGPVGGAVQRYVDSFAGSDSDVAARDDLRPGSGEYRFADVRLGKPTFAADEPKIVRFRLERRRRAIGRMYLAAHVVDELGQIVAQCDSRLIGEWLDDADAYAGEFRLDTPWLKPGTYHLDLYACTTQNPKPVDLFENACRLRVSPLLPYPNTVSEDGVGKGVVLSSFNWSVSTSDGPASDAATGASDDRAVLVP